MLRFVALVDKEPHSDQMTIRLSILEVIDDEKDAYYGQGIMVTEDIFREEHVKACEELTKKFKMKGMNCHSIEKVTVQEYNSEGVRYGQRVRITGMHGSVRSGKAFVDNLYKAVGKMKGENSLYIYVVGTATATPFEGRWDNLPTFILDYFNL